MELGLTKTRNVVFNSIYLRAVCAIIIHGKQKQLSVGVSFMNFSDGSMQNYLLFNLKLDKDQSVIANTNVLGILEKYDSFTLCIDSFDFIYYSKIYIIYSYKTLMRNDVEKYQGYIQTSSISDLKLENYGSRIRILTKNSTYVFNGDGSSILRFFKQYILKK